MARKKLPAVRAKRTYTRRAAAAPDPQAFGLLLDHYNLTNSISGLSATRASVAARLSAALSLPG